MFTGWTLIMIKPKKIVLFDIDHTIFNTIKYRKNLYKNLAKMAGSDVEEFSKTAEKEYAKLRKITYYLDPDIFLKTIVAHSEKPIDLKKIQAVFWDKLLYEECIYPDVKEAFDYLNKDNIMIGIFSTGDPAHQSIKIESLKEYLSENHIHISKDKLKVIKDTFGAYENHQIYLVDDYPQILENAKLHYKNIFTIFIKRKESYPGLVIPANFKPDAIIANIGQITDIIKSDN